jgi:hypothetical protein
MTNPQKVKGSAFERLAVELLNSLIKNSTWKRVPGSGAIGTSLDEPLLQADIVGKVESIPKRFRVEAKVGYNSSKDREVKQFTLKKEWLDKVKLEAENSFSLPFLIGKFSGATKGIKVFVVMDVEDFASIINHITSLKEEIDRNNT